MEFYARLAELERRHEAFAVAIVIARRAPVSSHLGDRAIVLADGRMEGFVGGSCSRDVVRREALDALRSGLPRMLEIRPDAAEAEPSPAYADRVVVPMGCASEGAVDLYIEPHLPPRRLIVAGLTPVAETLARLAAAAGFETVRAVAADEASDVGDVPGVDVLTLDALPAYLERAGRGASAVVASQGHYDESVLEALARSDVEFVGLLASRKRADDVRGVLRQAGVAEGWLERLHTPVGLDLGVRTPSGVAVSILAQLVADGPATSGIGAAAEARELVRDPVCGMDVELATARHRLDHEGMSYGFCSAHCRAAFLRAPEQHAGTATTR